MALPLPRRALYLSLRVLGAGALAALLLNLGKWVRPSSETPSPWLVLLDRSASMAVSDCAGKSVELAEIASKIAEKQDVLIRLQPFAAEPGNVLEKLSALPAPKARAAIFPPR